jgi:hypothetical protein
MAAVHIEKVRIGTALPNHFMVSDKTTNNSHLSDSAGRSITHRTIRWKISKYESRFDGQACSLLLQYIFFHVSDSACGIGDK